MTSGTFHFSSVNCTPFVSSLSFTGAMAERTKLEAYIVLSFLNTFLFCFPAHWVWSKRGFLKVMFNISILNSKVVYDKVCMYEEMMTNN